MSLIPISNEDAFERNHRRVPYIREMIELMSQSVDGEALLCRYLAKNYTDAYVAIGQELGLGLDGVMTEIEAAAMWRDARLLDDQARIVLKHLRCKFKSKITGPFNRIYTLVEGYTKPQVKVIEYHADGEKDPEVVHAQYQDISREHARTVKEMPVEHSAKPSDVLCLFLIFGGDHGQDTSIKRKLVAPTAHIPPRTVPSAFLHSIQRQSLSRNRIQLYLWTRGFGALENSKISKREPAIVKGLTSRKSRRGGCRICTLENAAAGL